MERINILVVDDRKENLLALNAILPESEYRILTATSGEQALLLLLKNDFAVILLDVMMPGMDGYELAKMIRARERSSRVPIIFLTAVATDRAHVIRGYELGAADYLTKPLAPEIVKAKVNVFVELHKKTMQIKEQEELLRKQELRRKEYELIELRREQEERYRLLTESIPQLVWMCSPKGVIEYCNRRWIEYTGLGLEHIKDLKGWSKVVHPDDVEFVADTWRRHVEAGEFFDTELRVLRRMDHSYRWNLLRAVPMKESSGSITGWVGTYTDIEDQKRAEIELKNTIRSRDEFFSVASHELKTPLTSLKLRIEIFERDLKKEPGEFVRKEMITEVLDFVNGQLFRLENLIDNLLDISRIRLKQLNIKINKIDFAAIVRETVHRLSDQAKMVGSQLRMRVPEKVEGYWDRMRLEQLTTNLISNAIRYGDGRPIDIELTAAPDHVTLTVEDEGGGISEADVKRIFLPFERASVSRSSAGLGLGLFIVQQIVSAHGGKVRVEKREKRGSRFIVELPREPHEGAAGKRNRELAGVE